MHPQLKSDNLKKKKKKENIETRDPARSHQEISRFPYSTNIPSILNIKHILICVAKIKMTNVIRK